MVGASPSQKGNHSTLQEFSLTGGTKALKALKTAKTTALANNKL